jgi:three-Cys-motif partner protein
MTPIPKEPPPDIEADRARSLFPELVGGSQKTPRRYKRVQEAIWTENKAKFIQQYLRIFVQITKHGAYIDGFAGPQYHDELGAWAAALVLGSDPKWLRHFFLCELDAKGVTALEKLRQEQSGLRDKKGRKIYRNIEIWPGDFNENVGKILGSGKITQKEATFCLLDQRTFECHWSTVQKLAAYKTPPHNKIELLYFLGVGWLHRAFSGVKKMKVLENWWGKKDYAALKDMSTWDIAELVRNRFESELGYKHTAAYPIFDKNEGNRIMYYMIHASDHDEAPALMVRAHHKAVRALPLHIQQPFDFGNQDA